jgi:hypothetical protein
MPPFRHPSRLVFLLTLILLFTPILSRAQPASPFASPDFFPISVWLQQPANAPQYKAIGINTYVGLYRGPTAEQLDALDKAGLYVICHQNPFALSIKDRPTIIAWMHGDEPDNAQALPDKKGWGPPILPQKIIDDYKKYKDADPSRPIMLNLGQGVAWDRWVGRGVRSNHPEDYPLYLQGCDIASFDIYPAIHDKPEVAGNLWFVAQGVQRLRQWTQGQKPVWSCIECTHIGNPDQKPTPDQVKSEVWLALTQGATGLIYFCHQFQPKFIEAGLLADPQMSQAVANINQQIHSLAPILNSPTLPNAVQITTSDPNVPLSTLTKRHNNTLYVFAVSMRNQPTQATFTLPNAKGKIQVLSENRSLDLANAQWQDSFQGYQVHLYKIVE